MPRKKLYRPLPPGSEPPSMSSDHPYLGVTEGNYAPEGLPAEHWLTARPVAQALLTEDFRRRPELDHRTAFTRRSALARYLTWLAEHEPELLLSDPLDTDEIRRYLATDGIIRRSSYRSRVALRSILMSFREDPAKKVPKEPTGSVSPTMDSVFEQALAECRTFRNPVTRANARALLLLSRGAGLDGADLRWVRGSDITQVPGAGTWVTVTNPAVPRRVPVLARFADQIEDVAAARGPLPMLSAEGSTPIDPSTPGHIAAMVSRALKRAGYGYRIQVVGLRKAWMAEQIGANAPLLSLLKASGLSSLRSFDDLLGEHAPLPSEIDSHIAYELGGLE